MTSGGVQPGESFYLVVRGFAGCDRGGVPVLFRAGILTTVPTGRHFSKNLPFLSRHGTWMGVAVGVGAGLVAGASTIANMKYSMVFSLWRQRDAPFRRP